MQVVLKVLQQILRGSTPPDVVENGLQVLAALQRTRYHVILMDVSDATRQQARIAGCAGAA